MKNQNKFWAHLGVQLVSILVMVSFTFAGTSLSGKFQNKRKIVVQKTVKKPQAKTCAVKSPSKKAPKTVTSPPRKAQPKRPKRTTDKKGINQTKQSDRKKTDQKIVDKRRGSNPKINEQQKRTNRKKINQGRKNNPRIVISEKQNGCKVTNQEKRNNRSNKKIQKEANLPKRTDRKVVDKRRGSNPKINEQQKRTNHKKINQGRKNNPRIVISEKKNGRKVINQDKRNNRRINNQRKKDSRKIIKLTENKVHIITSGKKKNTKRGRRGHATVDMPNIEKEMASVSTKEDLRKGRHLGSKINNNKRNQPSVRIFPENKNPGRKSGRIVEANRWPASASKNIFKDEPDWPYIGDDPCGIESCPEDPEPNRKIGNGLVGTTNRVKESAKTDSVIADGDCEGIGCQTHELLGPRLPDIDYSDVEKTVERAVSTTTLVTNKANAQHTDSRFKIDVNQIAHGVGPNEVSDGLLNDINKMKANMEKDLDVNEDSGDIGTLLDLPDPGRLGDRSRGPEDKYSVTDRNTGDVDPFKGLPEDDTGGSLLNEPDPPSMDEIMSEMRSRGFGESNTMNEGEDGSTGSERNEPLGKEKGQKYIEIIGKVTQLAGKILKLSPGTKPAGEAVEEMGEAVEEGAEDMAEAGEVYGGGRKDTFEKIKQGCDNGDLCRPNPDDDGGNHRPLTQKEIHAWMKENSSRTRVGQPTPGGDGVRIAHNPSEVKNVDGRMIIIDRQDDAIQYHEGQSEDDSDSSDTKLTQNPRSLTQPVTDGPEQRHPHGSDPFGLQIIGQQPIGFDGGGDKPRG